MCVPVIIYIPVCLCVIICILVCVQSDEVYLEAQIQNITPGPIYMECVNLDPSPQYTARHLNATGAKDRSDSLKHSLKISTLEITILDFNDIMERREILQIY